MNQPTHPVSSLSLPDQTTINSFIKQTKLAYGSDLHTVILYGSKARGDANVESGIDLLIVINRDNWQLRHALSDIASHVSLAHDVTISVQLVSRQRWQQMKQEALMTAWLPVEHNIYSMENLLDI